MSKRFGTKYRRFALALSDIPDLCLPAILSTEGGRNGVALLERSDETTFRVAFPDGRESLVSRNYLEKIYDGICALPPAREVRSRKRWMPVLEQISNLLADNPFKVSAAVLANSLTLLAVLIMKAGYEQNISANLENQPLLTIGAGLTFGLMTYGITGLRLLLNRVKWRDGKRRAIYPDFAGSNADSLVDLAVIPVFLALSLSIGGIAMTIPLIMGIAFVASHFLRTRQLQSLLVFPRIWAAPLQWMVFSATILSMWLVLETSGLKLGGAISSLIITAVCMERMARTAGLARNFRIALMGATVEGQGNDKTIDLTNKKSFSGLDASNLFYTHPQSGSLGLFEVNLTIKPGERIGIFGVPGSGKSTLCRMLAGAICPEHGKVTTNGKIGYLGSDAAIVYGTLRSNILLGHGDQVPNYRIEEMVRFVGLEKLMHENPLGLEMPVQERGDSLSPIQRRALCLARVLLHRPEILILDEPACQLNREDADRFLQIIDRYWQQRPRTRIMISSISSTGDSPFTSVDHVMIMENGRVVGKSSPGHYEKIIEVVRGSGQNHGPALESAACHQVH